MCMYRIGYTDKFSDSYRCIEFIGKDKDAANKAFLEKKQDIWNTDVIAFTMTVDVVFNKDDVKRYEKGEYVKTYTYKAEDKIDPIVYKHVIVPDPKDKNDIKIGYPVHAGYKDHYEMAELKKKGGFKEFKEVLEALLY